MRASWLKEWSTVCVSWKLWPKKRGTSRAGSASTFSMAFCVSWWRCFHSRMSRQVRMVRTILSTT